MPSQTAVLERSRASPQDGGDRAGLEQVPAVAGERGLDVDRRPERALDLEGERDQIAQDGLGEGRPARRIATRVTPPSVATSRSPASPGENSTTSPLALSIDDRVRRRHARHHRLAEAAERR